MVLHHFKYVVKIFILIIIISLISDRLIFYTLNKLSDKVLTGQSIGKLNQYIQKKDSLEFIVFGSSRANHHINPLKLNKNSFNMGMDGKKIAYSYTLVKLLLSKKKQTIFFHIDPENAFSKEYLGEDILALASKYNRNDIVKLEIDRLKQNNYFQKYYKSLSYNGLFFGMLKNYLKPNYKYQTYYGFDPIHVSETQKQIFSKILKSDLEIIDYCDDLTFNNIYKYYIEELIKFCNDNNKDLIFFTSPKLHDNCINDNLLLLRFLKSKNIEYYDWTNIFKEKNNLSYWKDKSHLSNEGAEIFTDIVLEELIHNQHYHLQ